KVHEVHGSQEWPPPIFENVHNVHDVHRLVSFSSLQAVRREPMFTSMCTTCTFQQLTRPSNCQAFQFVKERIALPPGRLDSQHTRSTVLTVSALLTWIRTNNKR